MNSLLIVELLEVLDGSGKGKVHRMNLIMTNRTLMEKSKSDDDLAEVEPIFLWQDVAKQDKDCTYMSTTLKPCIRC